METLAPQSTHGWLNRLLVGWLGNLPIMHDIVALGKCILNSSHLIASGRGEHHLPGSP